MNDRNNKKANILCLISLACAVLPWVLWMITDKLLEITEGGSVEEIFSVICNIINAVSGLGWLAAIVLMIYVRVKYPKNLFGHILMWLYILAIIMLILCIIFIIVMCNSCVEALESCTGFLVGK